MPTFPTGSLWLFGLWYRQRLGNLAPGSSLVQVRTRLTTSTQRGTRGACQAIRQENVTKDMQVGKREVKLSPFADDTSLYRENSKESILKTISK